MKKPRESWLVATWPGMGSVGVLAVSYMVKTLGAVKVTELPTRDYFDLRQVEVYRGLMQTPRHPRVALYSWKGPNDASLRIVLAEAQPSWRGYALCEELINRALAFGVTRVATFAAMATQCAPDASPQVFAMATERKLVDELRDHGIGLLDEGAISGMNGILLAAAASRGIPAVCLLGEFPHFASAIPQPKAAAAVLRAFLALADVDLDVSELDQQADLMETQLSELFQQLQRAALAQMAQMAQLAQVSQGAKDEGGEPAGLDDGADDASEAEPPEEACESPGVTLDPAVVAQIEALFVEATRDRARALDLKALLDQQGVFKDFEDRFLDLFKQGE